MTAKVIEDGLRVAEAEIPAINFEGQDFAVSRPSLEGTPSSKKIGKVVINEAKHGYNECIQVQGKHVVVYGLIITIENAPPWTFDFKLKTSHHISSYTLIIIRLCKLSKQKR